MSATSKDLYMNFASVKVDYHATATQTLMSAQLETGLSIRGGLIWLIHLIEFWYSRDNGAGNHDQYMALSTRRDLTAMPEIGDGGCLLRADLSFAWSTSVGFQWHTTRPMRYPFLPPIPIAAPNVTLYAATDAHEAAVAGDTVTARIGFTTAPLSSAAYTEISEVWGW